MMRSLYSGVAGLRTHQTKMDVLGNNIANVNTTSFKSQSITFSDLMYQTTQTASGATETRGGVNARQIGLGAKSGAIATAIESQGATQTTNNPFDLMITGKAFFVVNNGKENLYTRDGSFYVDGAGNLAMQSNGYLVQGWVAQEDRETGEIKINKNGGLSALQIMSADNSTYSPASTTEGLFSGNIDDHDSNVNSDEGKYLTLEFYDNKGYLYTGKFTLKDTGTDHLFSIELVDIIDSDGVSINKTLEDGTKILDHITFGDVEKTKDLSVQKGYYVKAGEVAGTGTIFQEAGVVEFEKVPVTGTDFSNLSDIENFLEKVFPTLEDITKYSAITSYSISDSELEIIYDNVDYNNSIQHGTYSSFIQENKNKYYYNPDTNFGYPAPTESADWSTLNNLNADMLTNVFPDTAAYTNFNVSPKRYDYKFDEANGELRVVANYVPDETQSQTKTTTLATGRYDEYFTPVDPANTKTISEMVSNPGAPYTSTLYEYNSTSGELTVYGVQTVAGPASADKTVQSTSSALFNFLFDRTKGSFAPASLPAGAQSDLETLFTNGGMQYAASDIGNVAVDRAADGTYTLSYDGFAFDAAAGSDLETYLNGLGILPDSSSSIAGSDLSSDAAAMTDFLNLLNAEVEDIANFNNFSYRVNDAKTGYTITAGNGTTEFDLTVDATPGSDLGQYIESLVQAESINYADIADEDVKRELKKLINDPSADYDNAVITFEDYSLTGTTGYNIHVAYESNVEESEEIATYKKFDKTFEATDTYTIGVPTSVFRDNSNVGYCIFDEDGNGFTLDEIPLDILQTISGSTEKPITSKVDFKGEYVSKPDADFKISFTSGGKITVTHEQTDTYKKGPYDIEIDTSVTPNVASFKTSDDSILYPDQTQSTSETFPLTGNIVDLLENANGPLKGLLKKVYDIDDDDARAYGLTGKYQIDPESQKLTLTTGGTDAKDPGNKTVRLVFDAANGALISANDNSAGKGLVNLVFDQEIPGLEAFGFQKGSNDGEDVIAGRMTLDFSAVTNYNTSGSSTIKAVKGDKKSLNTGRAVGEMNGVTVSTDGQIFATYSNGQTKLLGQIASAEFANASGLSKEGDNLYSSTLNSGEATIQDITTDGGYMNTGVLEMSNVDLSREFTEMITTQRGFQANSRIITVSDTLLEELTNLKR